MPESVGKMSACDCAVDIVNRQDMVKVSPKRIRELVGFVFKKQRTKNKGVTVYITNDRLIKDLNSRYLGKDSPTDVIAFGLGNKLGQIAEKCYLGDIAVSAQTAKRVSKTHGVTVNNELERYVVHGLLHLLGFDDKSVRGFRGMRRIQERYMEEFYG
jgi:probable rRNA maturation factor